MAPTTSERSLRPPYGVAFIHKVTTVGLPSVLLKDKHPIPGRPIASAIGTATYHATLYNSKL